MPDARAFPPIARQRRSLRRSPAFLVRPQLLTRFSSLPAGRGFVLSDLSTADPLHLDRSFVTVSLSGLRQNQDAIMVGMAV
jgi:hypothetical protein